MTVGLLRSIPVVIRRRGSRLLIVPGAFALADKVPDDPTAALLAVFRVRWAIRYQNVGLRQQNLDYKVQTAAWGLNHAEDQ